MLKNASSLAIVGLDTAENGPSKVRQVTNRIEAIIGTGAAATALRAAAKARNLLESTESAEAESPRLRKMANAFTAAGFCRLGKSKGGRGSQIAVSGC